MRIAAFSGSVANFKLYLLARRTWLENEKGPISGETESGPIEIIS